MFEIVPLKLQHLDEMYEIEKLCFSVPWTKDQLKNDIKKPESVYFAALENGRLTGYAGMWHVVNEGHITNIAVEPAHRRRGIGAALLDAIIAEAHKRGMIGLLLEVRVGNYAAQGLYLKNGFELERIRTNYYSDTGENAYVLWKTLETNKDGKYGGVKI